MRREALTVYMVIPDGCHRSALNEEESDLENPDQPPGQVNREYWEHLDLPALGG